MVLAASTDAFAQRRGGGGGRGGGGRGGWSGSRGWGGVSIGVGYPGFYGGYGSGYGDGYYGGRYYGGRYYDSGYYYPSDYTYSDAYTYPSTIQQSYYPPSNQQSANVMVMLPNPTAQVWFNGAPTSQQGMQRTFFTPPLEPGNYSYTVKARWMENGQQVERDRTVSVQPGQTVNVDFRGTSGLNSGETLPLPKRPQ